MLRNLSSNSTWPLETEVEYCPLERHPVPLALAVRDVRMCPAGDDVHHVRVPFDDRRQRLDRGLEPFPPEISPKVESRNRSSSRPLDPPARWLSERTLDRELAPTAGKHGRRAVGHDADLLERAGAALDEQAAGGIRHHDHELGLAADRRKHTRLMRCRLREDGVQRHDERL